MEKKITSSKLPDWLNVDNADKLKSSHRRNYIQVNIKTIIKLLDFFTTPSSFSNTKTTPWVRLVSLIVYTIIISISTNLSYLWILSLILCSKLVILPSNTVINILKKLCCMLVVSSLILLPSIVMSHTDITLFLIRIGLILINLSLFSTVTSWQQFIIGLRQLCIPSIVLLIMDITIKYIYVLGMFLEELLYSIRLRTLGQRVDSQVMGVLLGQLYLSTKERTTQTYQAMLLRGYSYEAKSHSSGRHFTFNYYDLGVIIEIISLVIVFYLL